MSRYQQYNSRYEMCYGQDHLVGLFIQIFDLRKKNDEDEGLVVDLDQWKDALTPVRMAEVAARYGFHIELPEDTIQI